MKSIVKKYIQEKRREKKLRKRGRFAQAGLSLKKWRSYEKYKINY